MTQAKVNLSAADVKSLSQEEQDEIPDDSETNAIREMEEDMGKKLLNPISLAELL